MTVKDNINPSEISSVALAPEAALQRLFPHAEDSSRLTVCCSRINYSASRIARAVEDCDAHLLNLNVTAGVAGGSPYSADDVVVELRVNHRNAQAVARSLERYGFRILALDCAPGADADTVRSRVNELIHYLEV